MQLEISVQLHQNIFGESSAEHSKNKQTRNWSLDSDHKGEEDEHVSLGVYKNYRGCFSKNVNENMQKQGKGWYAIFSKLCQKMCKPNDLIKILEASLHSEVTLRN